MKLTLFRGGVHPPGFKEQSASQGIENAPLPARLYVPLQQHLGAPAQAIVRRGQQVLKGELIGRASGPISAAVHAPTSGTVVAIGKHTAPHPSGLPIETVVIEADGNDTWCELHPCDTPFDLDPDAIAAKVGEAGIVGLGGATFPSAVKLKLKNRNPIHTLIINGGECEPYLTCDDRLMREESVAIVEGVRLMLRALEAQRALVVIEDNKPEAFAAMHAAAEAVSEVEVVQVPSLYPMGSEKQMIETVLGQEVPAGGMSSDLGVVVHNVGTAFAVHRAVRFGEPLIERITTVAGSAIVKPRNLRVRLGTPVEALFAYCGGIKGEPARLLMGGPMMGQVLPNMQVPVVKGSSGILALTAQEVNEQSTANCIRCSRCVRACPVGLVPLEMAGRIRVGDFKGAEAWGLRDCLSCASCSYVCPAHIPLVQFFNHAKGELTARAQADHKAKETRRLAEARSERMERIKAEKAAAAAARKAARAKKAAEEESAAPAGDSETSTEQKETSA